MIYIGSSFWLFHKFDHDQIRRRAAREDENALMILLLVLAAIMFSFVSALGVIGAAKQMHGTTEAVLLGLAGFAILVSWTVMQVVFTVHYAHEYYQPTPSAADAHQGLRFPGETRPDYWDFFYFTSSIGATSQTSDVEIRSRSMRRLVAFQAVISFIFNTMILALAINLAAGLV